MRTWPLLLLLGLLAVPARADVTALLPVVAAPDAEASRALVDAALRGELRRLDSVVLQPQADTERHVQGAAALGIDCDPTRGPCAGQLAALCGVPLAVRGRLSRRDDGLYLELVRFQVPSGEPLSMSSGPLDENDVVGSTRSLVNTLYGLDPIPMEHTPVSPASPPPPVAEPAPAPAPARPDGIARDQLPRPSLLPFALWSVGATTLTLGALTASAGALVALSSGGLAHDDLEPNETARDRYDAIGAAWAWTATLYGVGGTLMAVGAGVVTAGFFAPPMTE